MGLIATYHKNCRQKIEKKGEGGSTLTSLPFLTNDRGFSLLEMMIANFILAVSVLGLLSITTATMGVNKQNDIRNTAVRITTQMAEILDAQPIDNIVDGGLSPYDNSNTALKPDYKQYPNPNQTIRGFTQAYVVTWDVTTLTNDLREIQVTVQYTYQGHQYSNNTVVYKHKAI